ncbi:MAG: lamin tail domain-containing protein, partial [Planctomycetota bacterium]
MRLPLINARFFSALCLSFVLVSPLSAQEVFIEEIHYAPYPKTLREEFVEIVNRGDDPVDLDGWSISGGVRFDFPAMTLDPGERLAIAQDVDALADRFGPGNYVGPFEGRLSNRGENVILRDERGFRVDVV